MSWTAGVTVEAEVRKLSPRLALQVRRQWLLFKFIGCGALTHQALHMCANLSRHSSFNMERECLECREGAEALARGSAPSPTEECDVVGCHCTDRHRRAHDGLL